MINSLYDNFKHWSAKGSVYIISDPHFDDSDCKLINPNWPSPADYIANLNKKIHKNDTLICLGDVGDPNYIPQIKAGYKVLITGNHDSGISCYKKKITKRLYDADDYNEDINAAEKELKEEFPTADIKIIESYEFRRPFHRYNITIDDRMFDEVYNGPLFIADRLLLSHEPIFGLENFAVNLHGHEHNGATIRFRYIEPLQIDHIDPTNKEIYYKTVITHINLAADVAQWEPVDLGKLIKEGLFSNIPNYHRLTIDRATENKNKNNKIDV